MHLKSTLEISIHVVIVTSSCPKACTLCSLKETRALFHSYVTNHRLCLKSIHDKIHNVDVRAKQFFVLSSVLESRDNP